MTVAEAEKHRDSIASQIRRLSAGPQTEAAQTQLKHLAKQMSEATRQVNLAKRAAATIKPAATGVTQDFSYGPYSGSGSAYTTVSPTGTSPQRMVTASILGIPAGIAAVLAGVVGLFALVVFGGKSSKEQQNERPSKRRNRRRRR